MSWQTYSNNSRVVSHRRISPVVYIARTTTLLVLLTSIACLGQQGPLQTGSVSGTVIDAVTQEPIAQVRVALSSNINGVAATTDAEGVFVLQGIPPGRQTLIAIRSTNRGDTLFSVTAGERVQNLTIRMSPNGVISGRVLDPGGRPLVGAGAGLLQFAFTTEHGSYNAQPGQANTGFHVGPNLGSSVNAQGDFRILHVPPGNYYVQISSAANTTAQSEVLYPGVQDLSKATLIHVNPGEEVRLNDVIFAPSPLGAIRARVIDPTGETRGLAAQFTLQHLSSRYAETYGDSATQEITRRPRWLGQYQVCARLSLPTSAREFDFRTNCVPANYTGSDIAVEIRIEKPQGRVTGRVLLESPGGAAPKPFPGQVVITNQDGYFSPHPLWFFIDMNGTLASSTRALPAGKFELTRFIMDTSAHYVESVRQGVHDVLRDGLLIAPIADSHIEILLSASGGVLSGRVLSADGTPSAHCAVVLVPQGALAARSDRGNTYRTANADQNGHYEFTNLIPGDYRAYAVSRLEGFHFWDPPSISPFEKGMTTIRIEKGRRHAQELKVIER